jgi:hypothetical protein
LAAKKIREVTDQYDAQRPAKSIIDESMRIRLRDEVSAIYPTKAPDEAARDESQPHTALVGE